MINCLFCINCSEELKDKVRNSVHGVNIDFKSKNDISDLNGYEVVVGNVNKDLLVNSDIKWLQLESAGCEKYMSLLDKMVITNTTGAYGEAISEYMLASLLMFNTRINQYLTKQKYHLWNNLGKHIGMNELKILVVGLGDIGKAFARKANAMHAKVYGIKRSTNVKYDYVEDIYTLDQLPKIIGEFDVVAISLPGTDETFGLFDHDLLSKMKKDSVLINVGRGKIINTNDLIRCLDEGYFRGVYLDVVDPEPLPMNNKLWNYDRVLITPHISGGYNLSSTLDRVIDIVIDNLNNYADNKQLINTVDKNGYANRG